jgi:hypothetical protein
MRIRIIPFAIRMLFELFWGRYDMTTWQFDLFFLQQVIKNPIALSNIKCAAHLILPAFRSWLKARAYEWFRFRPITPFSYAHIGLLIVHRLATILDRIDMTLIPRFIARHGEAPRLFGSTFIVQSLLQDLANIGKDMTF